MAKRLLLTLLIITFISILTGKRIYEQQLPTLEDVGFNDPQVKTDADLQPLFEDFEHFVEQRIAEEGLPGAAIAIVKDSNVVYLNTFGLKERHSYDSVNIHTAFRLASVSKGFAPVLTAMLVEDGLLDWDDRVIDHMPDFRLYKERDTEALTLRHVLSHTTGLPRHTYSNLLDDGVPYPEIRDRLKNVPPSHRVGTFYNYQNVAYSLIADVVEAATGKSYQQLLEERIFDPLDMRDASASYNELINHWNVAVPHMRSRRGYEPIAISPNYYSAGPAAGVNASITDMTYWLRFLLGYGSDLLADSLLGEIFNPYVDIPRHDKTLGNWRSVMDRAHYAMGWRVLECGADKLTYHGGYVNGYRSEVALFRKDGIGIAILTNAPSYFISDAMPTFVKMYQAYKRNQAEENPLLSLR